MKNLNAYSSRLAVDIASWGGARWPQNAFRGCRRKIWQLPQWAEWSKARWRLPSSDSAMPQLWTKANCVWDTHPSSQIKRALSVREIWLTGTLGYEHQSREDLDKVHPDSSTWIFIRAVHINKMVPKQRPHDDKAEGSHKGNQRSNHRID